MKLWTTQAKERLEEYLDAKIHLEQLNGEDAREMREDLAAHIHEEVEKGEGSQVNVPDVMSVIRAMDQGINFSPPRLPEKRRTWLVFFGVIFPGLVSIFEIIFGFCGGVFFDPVPTAIHSVMVLLVPSLNLWLLTKGRYAKTLWRGMAAGYVVWVSCIYALLFLPLAPLSVMALTLFGLGLLSLMPILLWVATLFISKRTVGSASEPWRFRHGWWIGAALGVGLFLALELPATYTRIQLSRALSSDSETSKSGLASLRRGHSERTLLRACYEGNRGTSMATDISGWIMKGWKMALHAFNQDGPDRSDSARVRDVFFRATGRSFNSFPPPRMVTDKSLMGGRGRAFEGFEFDEHLGGDSVAVRLKDLDLSESRFDGHFDAVSQIGYGEWTMIFSNTSIQAKEARCQVRLPEGGRVSHLTLWVNDEPREAAFSTVSKVKAAYREIAVKQQRDPVLVTMSGPDTVLVQCFPVPAKGTMKIRFGVTASVTAGRWEFPRIIERNFGIIKDAEHAVWLQSDQAFDFSGTSSVPGSIRDGAGYSSNAVLSFEELLTGPISLRPAGLSEVPAPVWCEDPFTTDDQKILQRHCETVASKPVDRLVVVIDGSASLARDSWVLAEVLDDFPSATILLADGHYQQISSAEIRSYSFTGGRDNEPSLRKAISLAKEFANSAVVWLHGPQAIELTKSEALIQLLERGSNRPNLYEVTLSPGPNQLSASLGKLGLLRRGPTLYDKKNDLTVFLKSLLQGGPKTKMTWQHLSDGSQVEGQKVSEQLARLWAIHESDSSDRGASVLAARYQLVTPVSGAVVLETQEQFTRHGLTPVDPSAAASIPSIPEPSTPLLILFSVTMTLVRRTRSGA